MRYVYKKRQETIYKSNISRAETLGPLKCFQAVAIYKNFRDKRREKQFSRPGCYCYSPKILVFQTFPTCFDLVVLTWQENYD